MHLQCASTGHTTTRVYTGHVYGKTLADKGRGLGVYGKTLADRGRGLDVLGEQWLHLVHGWVIGQPDWAP